MIKVKLIRGTCNMILKSNNLQYLEHVFGKLEARSVRESPAL